MGHDSKLQFEFPAKTKRWSMILMVVGVIAAALGWVADHTDHHQYWWANLLINGYFYFTVALGALFFYAIQYAAEVAWSAVLKRIFEAVYAFIPYGFAIIVIVLLAGQFHLHHIYHWMDPDVYDMSKPEYDEIIANKRAFFTPWFYYLRIAAYGMTFIMFGKAFRKWSLQEDQIGGTDLHYKMYRKSAVFLVLFAVFSSTMAWDIMMSIDTHWFSTMYGWYLFSGMWVSAMIFVTLLTIWLKKLGYLSYVNDSHIHDLGKWMFAVSMLWSYLWFCQYMLIWYSDISEEVTYFLERYNHYMYGMWAIFAVNFAVPFYMLIARDAKRNTNYLVIVGVIIFIGHFFDLYMAVIPGTIHGHLEFGFGEGHHHTMFSWWFELGMFLGFLGFFIYIVLNALTKAKLLPLNHPFLDESEHHSI
ncbi:MAG: quinol:cytochrome C oxidoreductase [Flavobacteriales bacterium]